MSLDKKMRILIVDDDATMLRILRNLLRQLEMGNVDEAPNGEEALFKLRKEPFRPVISDGTCSR